MCLPVIAAVGLGIAQAGLQIHGQKQAAKAQAKAQSNATKAEQQRYLQEVSAVRMRERQEQIASAQQRQRIQREAREARATARVSAGEAGVAGLSVESLINDMTRKEGEAQFSITQQEAFNTQNRNVALQDGSLRSVNNLLSINQPIAKPDYVGAVVGGAQTGLSAYSFGQESGLNNWIQTRL